MSMETEGIQTPRLPRATFNRSKKRIGTYRKGLIYPVYAKIVNPGDHVNLGYDIVARKLPTIAPSFTEERVIFRTYFVPLRTLWKDWKNWQTGFKEYSDNTPFEEDVPRWTPSNIEKTGRKSLWTHLGYPCNCLPDILPADFKRQAYAWIIDVHHRYRPIQDTMLEDGQPGTWKGEDLILINKDRDYFTTGLPLQQVGEAVSLPITGDTKAEFNYNTEDLLKLFYDFAENGNLSKQNVNLTVAPPSTNITQGSGVDTKSTGRIFINDTSADNFIDNFTKAVNTKKEILDNALKDNIVKMNNISSATISMIRQAFARQKRAELLAQIGVFHPDVLMLNYGVAPSYEILGLPTYLGGFSINMVNSEVLQTSQTSSESPLGEMGGHSMGVGEGREIDLYAKEFGVIMTLMYIKNENFYNAQGLPQEDYFISNEDLGEIAYQHMSEQPVPNRAILCISTKKPTIDTDTGEISFGDKDPTAETYNKDTFFFQPIFEFMTQETNDVVGNMIQEQFYSKKDGSIVKRNNLYYWHNAETFSIKDGERARFNNYFLRFKDDNRNYAVVKDGEELEDNYIIWLNIKANWVRVLDKYRVPGLIDHIGA